MSEHGHSLSTVDKAFALQKTLPFSEIELDLLLPFSEVLEEQVFPKGDTLFKKHDAAHSMYFLIEGGVFLGDQKLAAPAYFGDEELFSGKERGFTAVCASESRVLTLSRAHLYLMIAESPKLATGFLRDYSTRLNLQSKLDNLPG